MAIPCFPPPPSGANPDMRENTGPSEVNPSEMNVSPPEPKREGLEARTPPSAVMARLIEEVRTEKAEGPNAYNRMHNRHNRSR